MVNVYFIGLKNHVIFDRSRYQVPPLFEDETVKPCKKTYKVEKNTTKDCEAM